MAARSTGTSSGTFPFEARYLKAGDVRLHYVDEGPSAAPRCCSCTGTRPGATCGATRSPTCRRGGHRCVAFDHMGFGRSDKPPYLSAYSLRAHMDNALALIDALDLRDVVLVAHDWGGPIGLGAMLERRDRLRGLVLMNTWAWELPSFLPPFLREFRTEGLGEILALGRQPVRGVDARRAGPPGSRPVDDGRLPRAVPGLLVARGDARLPARDPADRARPQRAADGLDPRAPGRASTSPFCWSGAHATGCSSRCSSTSGASCSPPRARSSSTTPGTSWWRTAPTR